MFNTLFVCLGGFVVALDKKTGDVQWETGISAGRSQIVAYQEKVYVVTQAVMEPPRLVILDAKDGKIQKKIELEGKGQAPTLLVEDEFVFVTSGGVLSAFNLEGVLLWKNEGKGKGNGVMGMATANKDRQADEY